MRKRLLASTLSAALMMSSVAVACPNAGDSSGSTGSASTSATSAAKKKCKPGYHAVKKHGKWVCKRTHYTQQQG